MTKEERDKLAEAFFEGMEAQRRGQTHNPYWEGELRNQWHNGYNASGASAEEPRDPVTPFPGTPLPWPGHSRDRLKESEQHLDSARQEE